MGSPGGGTRVLLVEDNPGDARLIEITLSEEPGGPYHLERAGRISQALARLDRDDVDVVLLDLWLPDSRDWQGLRQIRQKSPRVPVIVLTGSVDPRLLEQAIGNGAIGYHLKGVFPKGFLARTLRSAIVRHRADERLAAGERLGPAAFAEIRSLDEGAAFFEEGRLTFSNEALSRISGLKEAELASGPAWLRKLAGETPGAGAPRGPKDAPVVRTHGDLILDRPDGSKVDIEYATTSVTDPGGRRAIVWLRIIEPEGTEAPEPSKGSPKGGRTRTPKTADRSPPSGSSVSGSGEVLDPTTWRRLAELAGPSGEFLPELVETFRREGQGRIDRMWAALDAGDPERIRATAHALRSGAAQIGAHDLERICEQIEASQVAYGEAEEVRDAIHQVEREFARASKALGGPRPGS